MLNNFNIFTERNAREFMNTKKDNTFPCSTHTKACRAVDKWLIKKMNGKEPCQLRNYISGPKDERQAIEHYIIIGSMESRDKFGRCPLNCQNCNLRMMYRHTHYLQSELNNTKTELQKFKTELQKFKIKYKEEKQELKEMMHIMQKEMVHICNNELKSLNERLNKKEMEEDSLCKHVREVESRKTHGHY